MKETNNFKQNAKLGNNDFKKSLTFLVDPNEDDDHSNSGALSDIDDVQIDVNKLNSVKLYSENNFRYISRHVTEAEVVVEEIINKIKKEALFLMVENHILSKLPIHSSDFSLELLDLIVDMAENSYCIQEELNSKASDYFDDEEPVHFS